MTNYIISSQSKQLLEEAYAMFIGKNIEIPITEPNILASYQIIARLKQVIQDMKPNTEESKTVQGG
jgi:hypothetical protein